MELELGNDAGGQFFTPWSMRTMGGVPLKLLVHCASPEMMPRCSAASPG